MRKEDMKPAKAHEHHAPHPEKACDCGPDCKCGCQEGKACSCGGHCGCGKKCVFKFLLALVIFLAGMGFNELIHGCCGPCPGKPHHAPMMKAFPSYMDEGGNTIIVINTDGGRPHSFAHHGKHADWKNKKHGKHFKFHGKKAPEEMPAVNEAETTPNAE